MRYLREQRSQGWPGAGGQSLQESKLSNIWGWGSRASQTQTESFSLNFMYFGCYPVAPSRSSVRLRHIFVIPESGPLLCGLDRRTDGMAWTARGGEGSPPPS